MQEKTKIDLKNRKILRELDLNARMPLGKLAKRVGLSRQVVKYRIERMQKSGILLGALTIFDSVAVGQRWFRVAMQLHKLNAEKKQEFITYFKNHPNILWLGEVGGNWDFVLNFISEDQFTFDKIFEKILADWGNFIQEYEVLVYINVRDQERGYILKEYETKNKSFFHEMKFNPNLKLDKTDKEIISLISRNAFLSYSEIAAKLGVSYKTVQGRMKEMEKSKLILGYRLLVHPAELGYESHMLFLGIQTYKPELEKTLYEFLKHPNVIYVVKQLGRWRIGVEAEFQNREEFQDFLVKLRTRFGEIISEYETFPIFRDHVIDYFPPGALK
ncbi:MAG: Lrp/AsnC family transcriptional regulator [bacterium]|nr:Lrp/AsnC family transcriptional regulator [bacterium]